MEILSSRVLLRPRDLERSLRFYEDTLGLAVYRERGEGRTHGVVSFLGGCSGTASRTRHRRGWSLRRRSDWLL
jgi:catechol 2,3-dioxygenase-like lactoylglutathione lyase family enzyme